MRAVQVGKASSPRPQRFDSQSGQFFRSTSTLNLAATAPELFSRNYEIGAPEASDAGKQKENDPPDNQIAARKLNAPKLSEAPHQQCQKKNQHQGTHSALSKIRHCSSRKVRSR